MSVVQESGKLKRWANAMSTWDAHGTKLTPRDVDIIKKSCATHPELCSSFLELDPSGQREILTMLIALRRKSKSEAKPRRPRTRFPLGDPGVSASQGFIRAATEIRLLQDRRKSS
jgi:hypothetical protein